MKVILDMDPGVDDAIALILALNNPEVDVLAVCTVAGNMPVDLTTVNALKIVEAMGRTVPVHPGAAKPLSDKWGVVTAEHIHGSDGLGNAGLSIPRLRGSSVPALDVVSNLIRTHRHKEISILATGPLTNIATLKQEEPDLFAALDTLSIMGGVYDSDIRGNVTEFAEFNFYFDPDAASRIMDSSDETPTILAAGLDVTNNVRCAVDFGMLSRICTVSSGAAQLAHRILENPVRVQELFNIHDVFAFFALLYPGIFGFRKCRSVSVDTSEQHRGRSVAIFGSGFVHAMSRVDEGKFVQHLLSGLK